MMYFLSSLALAAPLKDGDLVFQRSTSQQSTAIAAATGSRWTHVGLVRIVDGQPVVFEAVQPVRITPWTTWRDRGIEGEVAVRRTREPVWTADALQRLDGLQTLWVGRDYDARFEVGDSKLYCSELVRDAYLRAVGVELAPLRPVASYDVEDPNVRRAILARWGVVPAEQLVVAPSDLAESPALVVVEPPA